MAVSQPSPAPVQQLEPHNQTPAYSRGNQPKNKSSPSPFPPCRYTCPSCNENHYAFSCSNFRSMTIPQRKEYVRQNSLCSTCLKPGHGPADCRSRHNCNVCMGSHNTFLHTDQAAASSPSNSGTVNLASTAASDDSLHQNKLMMTCEALATGPTGKSMPVRALLDSGADVSVQVAKHLKLQKLDSTMAVATFGDLTENVCPTTHFTLSSFHRKDWSVQVFAVIIKKITSTQPRQDASIVREMPGVKGLTPADPHFHKPGRIDVLLGADVLPYIQNLNGPRSSIIAVETVFGHAFMGTYQSTQPVQPKEATIQVVAEKSVPTPEERVNDSLTKFWEVEEPPRQKPVLTPEEIRVQKEYDNTHIFLPSLGKYQVVFPRNQKELKLGDSRSRALQRFYSNEKALLRKGNWERFQQVIQEYLDLNHARPVTEKELQIPQSETYYLRVYNDSSSTTKLRVVFDASSPSTSTVSFNDTLAVGPMLHPTLDCILIKFRTYGWP